MPPFNGNALVSAVLSIVDIVIASVNSVESVPSYTSVILIALVVLNATAPSGCVTNSVVPPTTFPSTSVVRCGLTTVPTAPVVC